MTTLDRLQVLFRKIGGEAGLQGVIDDEIRLIVVRHSGWLQSVWKTHKETLESLGAYPVYDPEAGFGVLRDVHLPFQMLHAEKQAIDELGDQLHALGLSWTFDKVFAERTSDAPLRSNGERKILSLYTTKRIFEESKLAKRRHRSQTDPEGIVFHSSLLTGYSKKQRLDLVECSRHDGPEALSYVEVLNLMVHWHQLFIDDFSSDQPLLPRIGSGSINYNDYKSSASFGLDHAGGSRVFSMMQVDIEDGALDRNSAVGVLA